MNCLISEDYCCQKYIHNSLAFVQPLAFVFEIDDALEKASAYATDILHQQDLSLSHCISSIPKITPTPCER